MDEERGGARQCCPSSLIDGLCLRFPFVTQVCSNRGVCVRSPLHCPTSDVGCTAACQCDPGWGGHGCSVPDDVVTYTQVRTADLPALPRGRPSLRTASIHISLTALFHLQALQGKHHAAQRVALNAVLTPSRATPTAINQQGAALVLAAASHAVMGTSLLAGVAGIAASVVDAGVGLAAVPSRAARDLVAVLGLVTSTANQLAIGACSAGVYRVALWHPASFAGVSITAHLRPFVAGHSPLPFHLSCLPPPPLK